MFSLWGWPCHSTDWTCNFDLNWISNENWNKKRFIVSVKIWEFSIRLAVERNWAEKNHILIGIKLDVVKMVRIEARIESETLRNGLLSTKVITVPNRNEFNCGWKMPESSHGMLRVAQWFEFICGASCRNFLASQNHPSKSIGFVYSPLWKITHQTPSVLCTPPFEKSLIKHHRFCVLLPLKSHPSKSIGFVYSPLWKITVFSVTVRMVATKA